MLACDLRFYWLRGCGTQLTALMPVRLLSNFYIYGLEIYVSYQVDRRHHDATSQVPIKQQIRKLLEAQHRAKSCAAYSHGIQPAVGKLDHTLSQKI